MPENAGGSSVGLVTDVVEPTSNATSTRVIQTNELELDMKHEKALALRTLTEAMINANNLNDNELVKALKQELLNSLQADNKQPPFVVGAKQTYVSEAAVGDAGVKENPEKSLAEIVTEAIGNECPHCYIVSAIVNGEHFVVSDEDFVYGIGEASSIQELSSIMLDVSESLQKRVDAGSLPDLHAFTKRFGEFSLASIEAHKRLVAAGLAPKMDGIQGLVAGLMADALKEKVGRL